MEDDQPSHPHTLVGTSVTRRNFLGRGYLQYVVTKEYSRKCSSRGADSDFESSTQDRDESFGGIHLHAHRHPWRTGVPNIQSQPKRI